MKLNTKVLALMTALAAGAASAQNTGNDGTLAGTTIDNVATASFTDPTSNSSINVNSNTVTTTVLPKPGFDIVYRDGTDGNVGTTQNGNDPSTAKSTATLAPNQSLVTAYNVVNNGNTTQTITLAPQANAAYYIDVNGDGLLDSGDTKIAADANGQFPVTLPYDDPGVAGDQGVVSILQVITVPANAAPGAVISATPIGTGQTFDTATSKPVTVTESKDVLGLQYATVTVYSPSLTNNPDGSTNGSTTTVTTQVTVPGSSTPTTGYTDGSTLIAISGDQQIAYPKADTENATADSVTFTNTVYNGGSMQDKLNLFPTDSSNAPIGTLDSKTGIFTLPGGITVQFLDTNGTPLPIGADGYPSLTLDPGQSANYQVKVTYPDSNTVADPSPINIIVGVDSGLDAGVVAENTTTDTIFPPAMQFGDSTTDPKTADATLAPVQSGKPGTTVNFPMDLVNNGEYTDTFNLSGSVVFTKTDGTTVTVNVAYYVDTDGDGVLSSSEQAAGAVTSVKLDANTAKDLIAAVTIPATALATTTATQPTLQQSATGVYSTIVMTDTNDAVAVTPDGSMAVAKFVMGASGDTTYAGLTAPSGYATTQNGTSSALPAAALNYAIMAKNNYNTDVLNFSLKDILNKNLTYVSATCSILLKDQSTQTCTANFDSTSNTVTTSSVTLPQGAQMTLKINTTVK